MRPYIWNRRQKQGKREVERDFHTRLEFLDLGVPKAVQPMNFLSGLGTNFSVTGTRKHPLLLKRVRVVLLSFANES